MGSRYSQEHVHEQLSAYIDNMLGATEGERVRLHLEVCSDCRGDYVELRAAQSILRSMPVAVPPRAFTLTPEMVASPRRSFLARFFTPNMFPRLATGSALAFMLLLFVLVGDFTGRGPAFTSAVAFKTADQPASAGATQRQSDSIPPAPLAGTPADNSVTSAMIASTPTTGMAAGGAGTVSGMSNAAPAAGSTETTNPAAAESASPEPPSQATDTSAAAPAPAPATGGGVATSGNSNPTTTTLNTGIAGAQARLEASPAPLMAPAPASVPQTATGATLAAWTTVEALLALLGVGLGVAAFVARRRGV